MSKGGLGDQNTKGIAPSHRPPRRGQHVSFLHVDSDLYSSAATVFGELGRRRFVRPGCVVVFDELFNFPGFEQHELRALWEFLASAPHLAVEVLGSSTHEVPSRPTRNRHPQSAALRFVRSRGSGRTRPGPHAKDSGRLARRASRDRKR